MSKTDLKVKLEGYSVGGLGEGLLCPGCGCSNLHHSRVDVYARDAEDAVHGLQVVVSSHVAGSRVGVSSDMKDNPSPRRDGVRISFWCEQCSLLSEMTIVQHKGTTYLAMRPVWDPGLDVAKEAEDQ